MIVATLPNPHANKYVNAAAGWKCLAAAGTPPNGHAPQEAEQEGR